MLDQLVQEVAHEGARFAVGHRLIRPRHGVMSAYLRGVREPPDLIIASGRLLDRTSRPCYINWLPLK